MYEPGRKAKVTRLDELLPWNWTPALEQAAQAA
jgi:hypothetical protein